MNQPDSGGITSCLISGSWELLWNLVDGMYCCEYILELGQWNILCEWILELGRGKVVQDVKKISAYVSHREK